MVVTAVAIASTTGTRTTAGSMAVGSLIAMKVGLLRAPFERLINDMEQMVRGFTAGRVGVVPGAVE